eukprot:gene58903-80663_t
MKTILTFLIAILAFASTVAWAGERTPAAAAAAATAASQQGTPAPAKARAAAPAGRSAAASTDSPARSGADFRIELPDAPAVFCACVSQRRL